MFGTRQVSPPARGRSVLALSVLALLALGCLPVLAHADSSGIEYSDAPPTATGKNTIPTQTEPSAHSSKKNGGAAVPGNQGSNGGGGSGGGSSKSHAGSDVEAGKGANQQGSQGKTAANGGSKHASQTAHAGAEPASQESGGSSPLVPILIAIAILAAISIGAVVIRQRRRRGSGSGTPVSPEAG